MQFEAPLPWCVGLLLPKILGRTFLARVVVTEPVSMDTANEITLSLKKTERSNEIQF
jgi:hypothetical protein